VLKALNKITIPVRNVSIEREPYQDTYFFVDPAYNEWYDVVLFICFFPLYFLITISEHPPQFNMVEGCWDAWYGVWIHIFWIVKVSKDLP
jgi:hypothetical protein